MTGQALRARVLAGVLAALLLIGAPVAADVVLVIEPSVTAYTPGGTVDFTVRLTGATSLAAYNIEILIDDLTGGLPGGATDGHYWLVDLLPDDLDPLNPDNWNIATRPPDANYLFGANTDPLTRLSYEGVVLGYGIGLRDYGYDELDVPPPHLYGADTDPDRQVLAVFRVATGVQFSGTLRLRFDTSGLLLDDPAGNPIAGFQPANYDDYELRVPVIPEPTGTVLLAAGLVILLRRRLRERSDRK